MCMHTYVRTVSILTDVIYNTITSHIIIQLCHDCQYSV